MEAMLKGERKRTHLKNVELQHDMTRAKDVSDEGRIRLETNRVRWSPFSSIGALAKFALESVG